LSNNKAFSGKKGTVCITPQMQQLLYSIHNCGVAGSMRNLLIQSRVLELLSLQIDQFAEADAPELVSKADIDKLMSLKHYLDEHFLEDLSMAQLSQISLLNEFKLKKGFKAVFNCTVFNYIRNLRMQYALRLLLDSNLSIDEVADITGYERSQHFSTAFKRHFGVSPSSLRK
jgi:AraC family transcriptional activator of pyochelin receptor